MADPAVRIEIQPTIGDADDSGTRLQQWLKGIRVWHVAQSRAYVYYNKRSRALGLAVTLLSVLVGTSLFVGLSSSPTFTVVALVAGGISALAAILSAAQTFLNYGELSEKARAASLKYGTLRRELEEGLASATDEGKRKALMDRTRKEWSRIDEEAPPVPQNIYSESLKYVDSRTNPPAGPGA